jgi:ribosomal protein S18 acetylase RimI-like enzyme
VVTLQPMLPRDFPAFFEVASESYAKDNVASGRWDEADALALAREETKRLLPKDEQSPDNHLFVLRDDERLVAVGYLWYGTLQRGSKKVAFLFQLHVLEQFRGLGYGRQAMRAFEFEALQTEHHSLALNVFASNPVALKLYESVGYSPTSIGMRKALTRSDA